MPITPLTTSMSRMTDPTFTAGEAHEQTLALLAEVRNFLASWPPHPTMREMISRIDDHLRLPEQTLLADHGTHRAGTVYHPTGAPLLRASLCGHTLFISIPLNSQPEHRRQLLADLESGVSIYLKPTLQP